MSFCLTIPSLCSQFIKSTFGNRRGFLSLDEYLVPWTWLPQPFLNLNKNLLLHLEVSNWSANQGHQGLNGNLTVEPNRMDSSWARKFVSVELQYYIFVLKMQSCKHLVACTACYYDLLCNFRYLDHNLFSGRIPDALYKHTFLKEMWVIDTI